MELSSKPDFEALRKEIVDMATAMDHPELLEQEGMVRQLWSDGELTCQKSGSLLWQRSLHQFCSPVLPDSTFFTFPHVHSHGNSYVVLRSLGDDHSLIRRKMAAYLLAYITYIEK